MRTEAESVGMFGLRRFFRLSIALVILSLMSLASCGIDTISYLSTDPRLFSYTTTGIELFGADTDDDNYYGIQLFYKIYTTESDAIADRSSIISKQNAANTVPGSVVESYLISANGLAYRNPILDGFLAIPTISKSILLNSNYYISIVFPSASNVEPTLKVINGDTSSVVKEYKLRRNVSGSSGYLTFLDEPKAADADYRSRTGETDKLYYIQFFAASYGLNFNDFSELHGDAIFLGSLITVNY